MLIPVLHKCALLIVENSLVVGRFLMFVDISIVVGRFLGFVGTLCYSIFKTCSCRLACSWMTFYFEKFSYFPLPRGIVLVMFFSW